MLLLYLCGSILGLTFLVAITGITRHDMRAISRDKRYLAHPHARKWKKRPLISIVIDGEPTEACLASIRRSDYRKKEIVTKGRQIAGELIMSMAVDTILDRSAISSAVRELNDNPKKSRVELLPVIREPTTMRDLFATYRRLLSAPFVAARAGLDVTLPHSSWPTIIRPAVQSFGNRTRLYLSLRWVVHLTVIIVLAYVTYLAVGLQQPQLLVAFITAFTAWTIWSLFGYKHLSTPQKVIYSLLSPVSFGYLLYLCITAPFIIGQYAVLLPSKREDDIVPLIEVETEAEGKV